MSDAPLRFELERSEEARRKLRAELRTQRDEAQERVDEAEVRLAEAQEEAGIAASAAKQSTECLAALRARLDATAAEL